jgi:GNAT superfamily N-acetyltransferase
VSEEVTMIAGTSTAADSIRPARPEDVPQILALIRELAEYERLADQAIATTEQLAEAFFGPNPKAHALIVEADGEAVGVGVYFYNFSTFLGRAGIYVEDVYVRPEFRRRGLGRMVFQYLARKAVAEGCTRMEWSVLNWNEPAIRFYRGLGAVPLDAWTTQRLSGSALADFAKG